MRKLIMWMWAVILICGTTTALTSCEDDPVNEITPEEQGQKVMTYDEILGFSNRNDKKCRMLFIYGANDPWTGAAIPDPAADDPYVKKYIVPNGLHSGHLKRSEHYSQNDKDYIINTIRRMMANAN